MKRESHKRKQNLFKIFLRENKKLTAVFSHHTFIYLTLLGNFILILATTAVYLIEKNSPSPQIKTFFDALWWGTSTITTVAYGDILPQTFLGRLIGIALMYTGTVLFISFTGVLMSIILREEVEEEIAPLQKEIHNEELAQKDLDSKLNEILSRIQKIEEKINSKQ